MQQMIREAIERHLDSSKFQASLDSENEERARLQEFVANYDAGEGSR